MQLYLRYISLENDVWDGMNDGTVENVELFKSEVKKHLKNVENAHRLNYDLKTISDKEFFNIMNGIYHICLTKDDYLKIFEKKYGKKYNYFDKIKTNMTYFNTMTSGHGKDFYWWKEKMQVTYFAAVSEDLNLEKDYYTKDELEKLINEKSIVLVSRKDELKNKSLPVDNEEEVKEFDFINIGMRNCYEQLNNYVHEKSYYINDIIPMLREEFDNKKLILDVKEYLNKLKYEINDFIFWRKMPCTFDANEDPYNIWYENSSEKNMILGLSNILNNK